MKINEINQPKQVNEGIGSALIGDRAASAIRGFFSGKGTKQTMYQKAFLNDFYQDAITSLDNGVRGGFVDVTAAADLTAPGSDNNNNQKQIDPSAVKPGEQAAKANKAQQQTTQTLNNYIKQAAKTINSTTDKNQKIALTKELVNVMADRKGYPEWENALGTVQQIIKRANADNGMFPTHAINNLKAGKTMAEAYKIYYMNMLIESVGLTWDDLGLCVLKENNNLYLAEQKFVKMDKLFENIMEAIGGQGLSVAEFMRDWFNAYMQGTSWKNYEKQVLPQIQQIQDSYGTDRGKAAIKQLAKTALAISKLSPTQPKGAENVNVGNAKEETPGLADKIFGLNKSSEDIANDISNLDPETQKRILAQIEAAKAAKK